MTAVWRTTGIRWALGLGCLVALLLLPPLMASFQLYLVTLMMVYVIVAVGLNIVMGYAGQISVAHAAFMGVGGYTTALLMARLGWHLIPALLAGIALSTVLGFLVGIPALRVRGHYLALATLAFQLMTETVILNWVKVTRGPNGVKVPTPSLGPWSLQGVPLYYLVLVIAVAAFLFAWNLSRSRVGRAFFGIRDQEMAAQVMGVDLTWYKTLAFGLSAAYAGLAGGLFAITVSFLDPLAFTIWESIKHLIMVIFGGLGTVLGPVIGGVVISAAPELLRGFREHSSLIFYILLLVVLLLLPGGLTSGLDRLTGRFAARRRTATADPETAGGSTHVHRIKQLPFEHPPAAAGALLRVEGVGIRFGGLSALRDVSFTVEAGQIKGLIGPNGAGKTTMFNVLTRVYQPTEGTVSFAGEDLLRYRAHQIVGLGVSRTFQNVEMFASMTVLENVLMGMHHSLKAGLFSSGLTLPSMRREEREAVAHATEILRFLGLERYAGEKAVQLPLGLQRRIELARALAARPRLLLLDEPASGLSSAEADQLMADVRAIRDAGVTVLLIEHNMRFVMGLCDSITVLDQGEVICTGSPEEARNNPRVIEAYLGQEEYSHAGD